MGMTRAERRNVNSTRFLTHLGELLHHEFPSDTTPEQVVQYVSSLTRERPQRAPNYTEVLKNLFAGKSQLAPTTGPQIQHIDLYTRELRLIGLRSSGLSLEDIARLNNTTREKVRRTQAQYESKIRHFVQSD